MLTQKMVEEKPTLAIMAAGLGQRYGGLKQIDPVHGDAIHGYILLEYAIYDALKVGFDRIVMLIRKDFEDEFIQRYGKRIAAGAKMFNAHVDYAYQESLVEIQETMPFREKILGTGYATLCLKNAVRGPFAVMNADDFYGRASFKSLYHFFKSQDYDSTGNIHILIGFRLKNAVPSHGPFARAMCEVSNGFLESIVEREKIIKAKNKIMYLYKNEKHSLDKDSIVSTNLWGFNRTIFPELENDFKEFLRDIKKKQDPKKEYYLPDFVSKLLANNKIKVRVLQTEERCFGMTYKEEHPIVVKEIMKLIERGLYPDRLWGGSK